MARILALPALFFLVEPINYFGHVWFELKVLFLFAIAKWMKTFVIGVTHALEIFCKHFTIKVAFHVILNIFWVVYIDICL